MIGRGNSRGTAKADGRWQLGSAPPLKKSASGAIAVEAVADDAVDISVGE